jgi:hypothetical protein
VTIRKSSPAREQTWLKRWVDIRECARPRDVEAIS